MGMLSLGILSPPERAFAIPGINSRPFLTSFQRFLARYTSLSSAEGLITKVLVRETGNFDYRARDSVAQVVRLEVEGHLVDVYVTCTSLGEKTPSGFTRYSSFWTGYTVGRMLRPV